MRNACFFDSKAFSSSVTSCVRDCSAFFSSAHFLCSAVIWDLYSASTLSLFSLSSSCFCSCFKRSISALIEFAVRGWSDLVFSFLAVPLCEPFCKSCSKVKFFGKSPGRPRNGVLQNGQFMARNPAMQLEQSYRHFITTGYFIYINAVFTVWPQVIKVGTCLPVSV